MEIAALAVIAVLVAMGGHSVLVLLGQHKPFGWMIAAALVAREVSIWIGLAIAARGRRVKARNVETRTAWDREQEEKKAEYERTGAAPA